MLADCVGLLGWGFGFALFTFLVWLMLCLVLGLIWVLFYLGPDLGVACCCLGCLLVAWLAWIDCCLLCWLGFGLVELLVIVLRLFCYFGLFTMLAPALLGNCVVMDCVFLCVFVVLLYSFEIVCFCFTFGVWLFYIALRAWTVIALNWLWFL